MGIRYNAISGLFDLVNNGADAGTVIGPASSTDNAVVRWDGTSGTSVQNSSVIADDSGNVTANNLILSATTATTVPYLNASKQLTSSAVTPTELGYSSGVTSAIQTQLGTKADGAASSTDNAIVRFDSTTGKLLQNSTVTLGDTGAISNTLTGNVVGLRMQTAVGNTAKLAEFYLEDGATNIFSVSAGGAIEGRLSFKTNAGQGFDNDSFYVPTYASRLTWNSGASNPAWLLAGTNGTQDFLTMFQVTANEATTRGLIVKGATSQSAALQEWRNSSDAVLVDIKSNGTVQADSGFGAKRTATAISYQVLNTDYVVGVTSNAAQRTVTLPEANTTTSGQMFMIKDEAGTAASANNIIISRAGADTIDGATSINITADYGVLRVYSNGSNAYFTF